MAFGLQGGADEVVQVGLQRQDVRVLVVREARGVGGHLNVHAEIDHVDHVLHVRLRLHAPAHVSEGHERIAVLHDEARDDRVEGPFVRRHDVRAARVQRERDAAVLQHEPVRRHGDAASVDGEHAVDERYHVAPPVGRRQVDRPALDPTLRRRHRSVAHVDTVAERGRVRLREQLVHRDVREVRVGVVRLQVRVGELLGLDQEVPVVRVRRPQLGEAHAVRRRAHLEDVQHLERREALSGRRQLEDVVAVVVGGDRLDPLGLEVRQVGLGHHAAARLDLGDDRVGDRALVVSVPAVLAG